jgi:hypothetical protein
MTQRQEVHVLQESVDDAKDDRFAMDSRESLNKVHGHVRPDNQRQFQWL